MAQSQPGGYEPRASLRRRGSCLLLVLVLIPVLPAGCSLSRRGETAVDLAHQALEVFSDADVEPPGILVVIDSRSIADRRAIQAVEKTLVPEEREHVLLLDQTGNLLAVGLVGRERAADSASQSLLGVLPRGAILALTKSDETILIRPPLVSDTLTRLTKFTLSNKPLAEARERVLTELHNAADTLAARGRTLLPDYSLALFTDVCVTCPTGYEWERIVHEAKEGRQHWTVLLSSEYAHMANDAAGIDDLVIVTFSTEDDAFRLLLSEARALALFPPFKWNHNDAAVGS